MWQNETLKIVRTLRVLLNLKWAFPGRSGFGWRHCAPGMQTGPCNRAAQTRTSASCSAKERAQWPHWLEQASDDADGPKEHGSNCRTQITIGEIKANINNFLAASCGIST